MYIIIYKYTRIRFGTQRHLLPLVTRLHIVLALLSCSVRFYKYNITAGSSAEMDFVARRRRRRRVGVCIIAYNTVVCVGTRQKLAFYYNIRRRVHKNNDYDARQRQTERGSLCLSVH